MKMDEMTEGFGGTFWSWIFFKKWNFFYSVRSIALCYGLFALLLGFLAVLTAIIYIPLQSYKIPYADRNGCITNTINQTKDHNSISGRCEVTFEITKQMSPPVHFLYYIENQYINHRNYINSYSKAQLEGNIIDLKTAQSKCTPFVLNKQIGKNVSWSGKPLDPNAIASPCGFKAFLFFNDTFKLKNTQAGSVSDIKIDESQIGQIQGLGIDFKSRNADEQWINPADQHFVMWMQNQALMTKQKLWGRIQTKLLPGRYSLLVQNNYQINNMRIRKGIRLQEASKIGGKSYFISIFFGLGAIGCAIYGILFYRRFKQLDLKQRDD